MTLTTPPRRPITQPRIATSTTPTATTTPTTTATAMTTPTSTTTPKPAVVDGVDRGGNAAVPASTPSTGKVVPVIAEADLKTALSSTQALASSSNPTVAGVFDAANAAAARLQKATSIEVPIRLQVTTGKSAQALMNRTPAEIPGMLKERGGIVTFYPADEALRPFDVDAAAAQHLPKDVPLIAKTSKRQIDIALPDGSLERASLYALTGDGPQPPRPQFVGVVDLIAGEPFVKDVMPPTRLLPLPKTQPNGAAWQDGAIVEVSNNGGVAHVEDTLAEAGSPRARTWRVAADQKLDPMFSAQALAETTAIEKAEDVSLNDKALVDLTHVPFFAIDNDNSKDIDQAMHLERRPDGGFVLSYALADASHYIKPGSALFEGGMQRGASFYLPELSIPMLPSPLSEGVVSLNAHETHRAMVIQIRVDKDGNVEGEPLVQRAKIRSRAQITYGGVSAELEGRGKVTTDIHGKPVPKEVSAQLRIFEALGKVRMEQAKARGVVEPDRREMVIGNDGNHFFLKDAKSDYASKLNAELSILANVAGAEAFASKIPGVDVPGIYKVHAEPHPQAFKALWRQVKTIVAENGLPESWRWKAKSESLAQWVDRLKTLPTTPREKNAALALQMIAVRINAPSGFDSKPGAHSGLKLDAYGRFSAPMREQVGILSHAIVFAKTALESAVAAGLSADDARALWAPLLLGSVVEPEKIPSARRALAAQAQALLSSSPAELLPLAQELARAARAQAPGLSAEERALIEKNIQRAVDAGNNSKMKQGQVEGAGKRLVFDDIFANDLGGKPEGNPNAPRRGGTIMSVTPSKVYIQLDDPDVEVRMSIDDLRRNCPNASFHLDGEGVVLKGTDATSEVKRLVVGQSITIQATHHDGDKLHFAVV